MNQKDDGKIRLQKAIADAGVMSRRRAEEMIAAGRVTVNGRAAGIGQKVDPAKDRIAIDKAAIASPADKEMVYVALHKPRGFVTTIQDEKGRRCVADLVSDLPGRVYPVGRLDMASEGLLLMTNDGEFANLVMHPKNRIPKGYRVTLHGQVEDEKLSALAAGVELDGRKAVPQEVALLVREENRSVLRLVITEGRNREIRRMCEAVGLEVVRLKRTFIGPVKLGQLPAGQHRPLTQQEIAALKGQPLRPTPPRRKK